MENKNKNNIPEPADVMFTEERVYEIIRDSLIASFLLLFVSRIIGLLVDLI
jgi:hypothetical protein